MLNALQSELRGQEMRIEVLKWALKHKKAKLAIK